MRNSEKGVQIFKYFMLHSKSAFIRKRILFGFPRACTFWDIEPKRQLRASRSYRESPRGFFPLCRPSGSAECSYASNPTKETKRKGARLDSFSFCAHSTKIQLQLFNTDWSGTSYKYLTFRGLFRSV